MEQRKHSDWKLFRRLLVQARPHWLNLVGIFVLSMLAAPLALLTPYPLKIAVDSALGSLPLPGILSALVGGRARPDADSVLLLVVGLLISITLLVYLQALVLWIFTTYVGEKLDLEFRALLFRHVQRLSISYHDRQGSADSTYRIQHNAPPTRLLMVQGISPVITSSLSLVGYK